MMMDTEDITVLEMVEDHEIACDYGNECEYKPAAWVMYRTLCPCGTAGAALACADCKELRMTAEDGVKCHVCSEVYVPARRRYARIEAL